MEIDNKAIFLLTSPEADRKKVFGTGFAVAHKDGQLYLVTCAHVVKKLGNRVKIDEQEAEIAAIGSEDSIDLALLHIPCNDTPPLLNTVIKGKPNKPIQLCGYGPFSGAQENYILRPVKGRLGKSIAFESPGKSRVEAWDLHVDDDKFSRIQGGYSGSPLCDEEGRLIAVVSHEVGRTGERGYAIAAVNLKLIYPNIEELIPCFSVFDHTKRIQDAKVSLVAHVSHLEEVFTSVLLQLDRMDKKGVSPDDEEILGKIESFIEQHITVEEFICYFRTLDSRKRLSETVPDYARLAENLNKGQVVLCLGQELSHLLGAPVPSTEEIIRQLVQKKDFYGPLSELCEQEEILPGNGGRHELVARVRHLLQADCTAPLVLYDLLARLGDPLLIISAAYDDLLEQSLKGKKPFVVIYPNIWEKKCLIRFSDQQDMPCPCSPEELSSQKFLTNGYTVIYKLRGGFIDHDRETLLLSERDYLNFNQSGQQIPDYICTKLQSRALWFLGHHPESWEERLLVKSIQMQRDQRSFTLAVQKNISPFARAFWQDNHVQPFDLALRDFVQELTQEVGA
jgi:hypothetical protein